MNRRICDICGKEIKKIWCSFWGSKWAFWGVLDEEIDKDFCSEECLLKFIKEKFKEKIK